ncbi:MAG TPA: hypothetical protein VIV15_13365, partial [Anaerolineales bacterium]
RTLIAGTALALTLVACSAPDHGTVVEKKYHESYNWMQMVCAAYGQNGICTVYVPVEHHVPERWELCLRDGDDEGCREVDQVTYHKYNVGDYYDPDK